MKKKQIAKEVRRKMFIDKIIGGLVDFIIVLIIASLVIVIGESLIW